MSTSLSLEENRAVATIDERPRRILITGATGNIGSHFALHAPRRYALRLMVRDAGKADDLRERGEIVEGALEDLEFVKRCCEGVDSVLHLAAAASPSSTWDELLSANVVGTYNVFVAAKAAGCRRVVFASSIHAVSGYPADFQPRADDAINPGDLYGVSKCFGEAMGRYMAEQQDLSTIVVRIGAFQPPENIAGPDRMGFADAWVSPRDLRQLLERCIDAEGIRFAIVHGFSDNRFKRLDLSDTRRLLGYRPRDDFFRTNRAFRGIDFSDIAAHDEEEGQKAGIREDL